MLKTKQISSWEIISCY